MQMGNRTLGGEQRRVGHRIGYTGKLDYVFSDAVAVGGLWSRWVGSGVDVWFTADALRGGGVGVLSRK